MVMKQSNRNLNTGEMLERLSPPSVSVPLSPSDPDQWLFCAPADDADVVYPAGGSQASYRQLFTEKTGGYQRSPAGRAAALQPAS